MFALIALLLTNKDIKGQFCQNIKEGKLQLYIENIGQYNNVLTGHEEMGKILYGYEGFGMPVLFTQKGLIHLQRKITSPSQEEIEKLEKKGIKEDEIRKRTIAIERSLTMEWVGANPNVQIIEENVTHGYHTYGMLEGKARGFKKITYKELYPGIDVEYSFFETKRPGFEYQIRVKPGADVSKLKMRYGGDIKHINQTNYKHLLIRTDIGEIGESEPTAFSDNKKQIVIVTHINNNEITFGFPEGYDNNQGFIIDPFVTQTDGFPTYFTPNQIRDVNFDNKGNVYMSGGGITDSPTELVKYDSNGVWQWTFNGTLTTPSWHFGNIYGGWTVEKTTGNIYLGQGWVYGGSRIIRLNSDGIYDNYITNANSQFEEIWKLLWNNKNQILIGGGGITSALNFGTLTPPSTTPQSFNTTGFTNSFYIGQDISDIVLDTITGEMYTIYASGNPSVSFINNRIYKHHPPYNYSDTLWSTPSGFNTLREPNNRPYLTSYQGDNDLSTNIFALNSFYLFYWNGQNLKAFDKATGNVAGTPLVITSDMPPLYAGGIVADDCGNVFIGYAYGTIKVLKFNGITFDDSPPDISIPGLPYAHTHDLKFDPVRQLLYACGEGYVASFDVSSKCNLYAWSAFTNSTCGDSNGTITVTADFGIPPYQYSLNGINYQSSNIFTNLAAGTYTITVRDAANSITTTVTIANESAPILTANSTTSTCSNSNGSITATATGGKTPLQYSLNGATYQSSNIFIGLIANTYTIYVKDANGCITTAPVTIDDEGAPSLSANTTAASCSNNDGIITANAIGGKAPLQYSINGTAYQSSNIFTGLASGNYTVYVKDANACITTHSITVSSTTIPPISGISVYPNPTNNNQFTLLLGNQLQGSYNIRILDMTGQLVYKTIISNTCTCCTGSYSIKFPFLLSSGIYNVEVIDPGSKKNVQRLMVADKK